MCIVKHSIHCIQEACHGHVLRYETAVSNIIATLGQCDSVLNTGPTGHLQNTQNKIVK